MSRPTKYKKEYCQLIIEHMKSGYSITSFAARIGVSKDTIYSWKKKFPDFADAIKSGTDASEAFWSDLGVELARKHPAIYIFTMKSRFNWSDKPEPVEEDCKVFVSYNVVPTQKQVED